MANRREDAIKHWNELLWSFPEPEAVTAAILGGQIAGGLVQGGRPFCNVARPRFVTREEMTTEHRAVRLLARAVRKVRDVVLDDQKLHAAYLGGLDEWIGTILPLEPRVPEARSILRFDSFTSPDGVRFVELNGDIPMGSVCNDGLDPPLPGARLLRGFQGPLRRSAEPRADRHDPDLPARLAELGRRRHAQDLRRLLPRRHAGPLRAPQRPRDAEAGPRRHGGLPGGPGVPREEAPRQGTHGGPVYRIMHTDDCLERSGEIAPLLQAVKQRAVCMVNPFRSELLSHKYLFALLTDDSHDFGFTKEEAAAIRAHIPWGRILREDRTTDPSGQADRPRGLRGGPPGEPRPEARSRRRRNGGPSRVGVRPGPVGRCRPRGRRGRLRRPGEGRGHAGGVPRASRKGSRSRCSTRTPIPSTSPGATPGS